LQVEILAERQMASIPSISAVFGLAGRDAADVGSRAVTVAEAFRQTFDALMKARGWKGIDLSAATGLSSATVTKLRNGERFASAAVLEQLRVAFQVTPARLFDPDAALAQIGLQRRDSDTTSVRRHNSLAPTPGDPVSSASPSSTGEGGPAVRHEDSELLEALHAYWDQLTPEARLELVGHGMRLRKASAGTQPTFRRG
jgi:transcriptional regulator with XRE-family HTH domain